MSPTSGSCTLIIDGQRYVGFEYVAEIGVAGKAWGFLSGPAKMLKRARLMGPLQIEFAGGSPRDVTILTTHDSGMALMTFDPG